jgi:UDP-N-acetylglucosamine 2-epimerase (hydrolysing)
MDLTLAKTIEGLSAFIKTVNPGMIIVHGDRWKHLPRYNWDRNNILVAHIEGDIGTVDELIRHMSVN